MKPSLSLEDAEAAAAACLAAAREEGVSVSVAVVDEAGGLLRCSRMDGARAYTTDLAAQKARTAASVGVPTAVLEALHKAGEAAAPAAGRGGVPVLHEGRCAGAVGVSGARPEIDDRIAARGAAAVGGWAERVTKPVSLEHTGWTGRGQWEHGYRVLRATFC